MTNYAPPLKVYEEILGEHFDFDHAIDQALVQLRNDRTLFDNITVMPAKDLFIRALALVVAARLNWLFEEDWVVRPIDVHRAIQSMDGKYGDLLIQRGKEMVSKERERLKREGGLK